MPEKFIVPQFIDTEDKILGPITVRQFLLLLGGAFVLFIEYKILTIVPFIFAALVTAGFVGTFAFLKINGQPFHIFFANFVQTYTRPFLRVWNKQMTDADLRIYLARKEEIKPLPPATKHRPESTRLRDLALTVNTGGVYTMEEE